jgi:hypothetical protein
MQLEELEQHLNSIVKQDVIIATIHQLFRSKSLEQMCEELVHRQQKSVVLNLIKELQQYLLGINSGTTDSSMQNSNQMEALEQKVKLNQITLKEAIKLMC